MKKLKNIIFGFTFFLILFCSNTFALSDTVNRISIQSDEQFSIAGLVIAPDGTTLLAVNTIDKDIWVPKLLIKEKANNSWREFERLTPPGNTGIGLTSYKGQVFLAYKETRYLKKDYYYLNYRVFDGAKVGPIKSINNVMVRPQSFLAISATDTKICFAWEESYLFVSTSIRQVNLSAVQKCKYLTKYWYDTLLAP